jgi:tRNA1Val (adenine37-N6)-methyltransferase
LTLFHCQQFSVRQQRSAMKVCTDSLLFGTMTPVKTGDRVLDIGSGCGLLALVAAQLGAADVTAVELCPEACAEAADNFLNSPWAERLQAINLSIQAFAATGNAGRYDLIISNPPFFADHCKSALPQKRQARHTDTLSYSDLLDAASRLLAIDGRFYVLLPSAVSPKFIPLAEEHELYLHSRMDYRGFAHTQAKVAALCFSRVAGDAESGIITIYESANVYTAESQRYLQGFLLRFAD